MTRAVLSDPSPATAGALSEAVERLHPWQVTVEETLSRSVEEDKLSWFTGVAPPEYW